MITASFAVSPAALSEQPLRISMSDLVTPVDSGISAIPSFSYDREGLSQGSVLGDVFADQFDERPQADLRHVRDQLVEHTALPEQRMGPVFGGVDLEMAIHAEAFAGGAEQRQENDGEGVQEKKPVAPLRSGDAKNAWAHAETKVLGVAKARLDRPALGVIVDDPACARLGVAGGQTPGLFHVPGLDADD